jgi:ubiquinol-cytochrome c reductase cytochrome b subunit
MKDVEEGGRKRQVEEPATAADLGKFGSREWLTNVLTKYTETFAPLKNAGPKGEKFLEGEMAAWVKENVATLTKPENAESLKGLVEFLVSQGGRKEFEPFDPALADLGKAIFTGGKLASGSLTSNCSDCHALQPRDGSDSLGDGAGAGYPSMTGYAGKKWLKDFVTNPAHESFYGPDKNMMPLFEAKLSEKEMNLLIDWMVGDYFQSSKHH